MTLRNICIVVLLIAPALAGQVGVQPASVEGVVKNQKTGDSIPDVRVMLTPPTGGAGKSATTDADGRFTITGVEAGSWSVSATRTLFSRPRRNPGAVTLTVAPGQQQQNVQIFLLPTAVISGRIVNENRESIRSVRVEAVQIQYREGARYWVSAAQATSDDRGEYRLFNLQPGSYYVRAGQTVAVNQQAAVYYYPGVLDPIDAVPLKLEAGSESGAVDLTLRPTHDFSVQLKLGDAPPGSMATFQIQRRNSAVLEPQVPRTETAPDDTYRLRLYPGAYDLFVQVATPATAGQPRRVTHSARVPVNISNDDVDLGTVHLNPANTLVGRIVGDETLTSVVDPTRLTITFRAQDLPTIFTVSARNVTTQTGMAGIREDGTFTVPGIASGRFQVELVGLPAETYLISVRSGPRELLDNVVAVTGNPEPIELILGGARSVGTIEGTVLNAKSDSVPFSTVALVPAPDRRANFSAFRTALSDQAGQFSLRAVLPGDYRIFAWEEVEAMAWTSAEFLRPIENRGESVRVQKASQNAVSVRVIPAP